MFSKNGLKHALSSHDARKTAKTAVTGIDAGTLAAIKTVTPCQR